MKLILLFVWLFALNIITAQESEKKAVQKTIETFFDGFHKQDSMLIKQTVSENIIVQTIGKNKEGNSVIRNEDFGKFLKSIASIPDTLQFKEKLMSFNIQVDGAMANAWTPYEFWMNNTFHHCGVNSFHLFKDENAWKIIYLIDTRRKEDCQE
ncbi:MAG: nuclear transport factor 2 family protein [Maribacter sp.]